MTIRSERGRQRSAPSSHSRRAAPNADPGADADPAPPDAWDGELGSDKEAPEAWEEAGDAPRAAGGDEGETAAHGVTVAVALGGVPRTASSSQAYKAPASTSRLYKAHQNHSDPQEPPPGP